MDARPEPAAKVFPDSRVGIAFVAVLTVATVLSFVHRYVPSVLIEAIRADIRISDLEFSSLQTAFAITYAAATLTSGFFADRGHRLNIIRAGVFAWTAGSVVFALAASLEVMLAGRVLVGIGEAVLVPAGISLLCDFVPPERRGRAIALTYFGATLGTSLAFSGGGWLLDWASAGNLAAAPLIGGMSAWRQVVLLLSAAGVLIIAAFLLFREPPRPVRENERAGGRFGDLWALRGVIWLVLFAGSSIAFADFAYTTWQSALLMREHGLSASEAGQSLGLTALAAGTVGAWIGGWLSDRAHVSGGAPGRIRVVQWCALGLVLTALPLLVTDVRAAIGAFAAWQLAANIAYVAVAVTLQDLVTDRTRAMAASLSVCLSIGVGLAFGPSSVAALNVWLDPAGNALSQSLLIVLTVLGASTMILSLLLHRRISAKKLVELSESENYS